MIVVNADGQVAGRLSASVSKLLLKGEEVHIINSDKAVVSGGLKQAVDKILNKKRQKNKRDPDEGPKFPRLPHLMLKMMIRGMLPKKSKRGREALKRLKCHIGIPNALEGQKPIEPFKHALKDEARLPKKTTIGHICKRLGWNPDN